MAVVTYQCSTCKRTIDLVQNKQGLDWIGNCNITLGCRGSLIQTEVHPDFIRGSLPADVVGLKNWVQRQVLFNFTQTIERQNWIITHNLGTLPSVQVYVTISGPNGPTLEQILPTEIIYNSDDQLTLVLPKSYSGVAQLIARASNPDILTPRPRPAPITTQPTIQLTNQTTTNGQTTSVLTIATRVSTVGQADDIAITLAYTSSTGIITDVGYTASDVPASTSPWSDATRVMFKGKVYTVRTFDIEPTAGQVANGSAVALTGINPAGPLTLSVVNVGTTATSYYQTGSGIQGNVVAAHAGAAGVGTFTIDDLDGSLAQYFGSNYFFTITGSGVNDRNSGSWYQAGTAVWNPVTRQTTITVNGNGALVGGVSAPVPATATYVGGVTLLLLAYVIQGNHAADYICNFITSTTFEVTTLPNPEIITPDYATFPSNAVYNTITKFTAIPVTNLIGGFISFNSSTYIIPYPAAFIVNGDYTLYFTPNSFFEITGTMTINDTTWFVNNSIYDPVTQRTLIVPTATVPLTFPYALAQIVQSGTRQINPNEVIILLGSPPFTIFDKITTSYIDFTAVNTTATQFELFFNTGNMFADTAIEQTIYPAIQQV